MRAVPVLVLLAVVASACAAPTPAPPSPTPTAVASRPVAAEARPPLPTAVATRQRNEVAACAEPQLEAWAGASKSAGRTNLLLDVSSACDLLHLALEVDLTPLPGSTEDCYDASSSTGSTAWIALECLRPDGRGGVRGYRFESTRTRADTRESRLRFSYPEVPGPLTPGSFSLTWSWNGGTPTTRDYSSLAPAEPPRSIGKNYRSLQLP